ncbi:hypothetical protein FEE96_22505 [Parasedimentitalea maritima]|uniref:Bacterial transglutaminase-like N-terminal domain-containing protein n=2 Tax=Parasedimentitalea maritima TaxID=2578117 RepID=A0ABY2UNW9_9RHOB|nr:hypothetical protein FEE96_22505 [Zongyanglinia marina]
MARGSARRRQQRSVSLRRSVDLELLPSTSTTTHTTIYRYRAAVFLRPHQLMLRPREMRDLILTAFDLEITPTARIDWSHDVSGNVIAIANFDVTTDTLSIRSHTTAVLTATNRPVFPIAASATSYAFLYSAEDWAAHPHVLPLVETLFECIQ